MTDHDDSYDDIDEGPIRLDAPDVEALARPRVDLSDPSVEPPPSLCRECGRAIAWVWWPGRGKFAARWTPPKPCEACAFANERKAEAAEMERRQEEAGIYVKHRAHRWGKGWAIVQEAGEPWARFARRVVASSTPSTPRIGVAAVDAETAKAVGTWQPGHGSLFLHGPVGSGKSLWVSARMSALLRPEDGQDVWLTEDEMVERLNMPRAWAAAYVRTKRNRFVRPAGGQSRSVLVIDETEVVRRVKLAWKGDQVPLLRIARADVLVYDDLGTELASTNDKARDLAATCVSRLVDLRWREGRSMVVTSNLTLGDLGDDHEDRGPLLDRRTLDRLHEMVGDRSYALAGIPRTLAAMGYSWRHLPPEDMPDAGPIRERKSAAAGEREEAW